MPIITQASPSITQHPPNFRGQLYEHQKRVLHATIQLEKNSRVQLENNEVLIPNVGFLSCAPGAGKLVVILGLLCAHTLSHPQVAGATHYTLTSGSVLQKVLPTIPTNLLVVPESLMSQWVDTVHEFMNFTEPNQFVTFKTKEQFDAWATDNVPYPTIMLVTPVVYNMIAQLYRFQRVVFDEIDTIKIPNCKTPSAVYIWCLSSNITSIKSARVMNRGFLKNMLGDLALVARHNPIVWDTLIIHTDSTFLDQSISLPGYSLTQLECKSETPTTYTMSVDDINSIIDNGLEVDMCQELGITVASSKEHAIQMISDNFTSRIQQISNTMSNSFVSSCSQIKTVLDEAVSIQYRIQSAVDCPITHNEIVSSTVTMCCYNVFESASIISWVGQFENCPLCRKSITPSKLCFIQNATATKTKCRFEHLLDILSSTSTNPYARVLVYADESTIPKIKQYLSQYSMLYSEFSHRVIRRTVAQFAVGNHPILLAPMHESAYTTGLNMPFVTHIVLMESVDSIASDVYTQMIGRAYRIGRTTPLHVYTMKFV